MIIGELVQIRRHLLAGGKEALEFYGQEYLTAMVDMRGIVIKDHSPMRPRHVGRIVDVMWNNGQVEDDMFTDELEVPDGSR